MKLDIQCRRKMSKGLWNRTKAILQKFPRRLLDVTSDFKNNRDENESVNLSTVVVDDQELQLIVFDRTYILWITKSRKYAICCPAIQVAQNSAACNRNKIIFTDTDFSDIRQKATSERQIRTHYHLKESWRQAIYYEA